MQLYVLVLNHTEYLEPLFKAMLDRGIRGATVLDSTGMMRVLADDENVDLPMLGLLRHMYSPERRASKTVFVVLHGGLDQPDSGIAFALPLQYVKGLGWEA